MYGDTITTVGFFEPATGRFRLSNATNAFATDAASGLVEFTASLPNGRRLPAGVRPIVGDWNADGCSDIVQVRSVFVSNCAGALVELSTGATPATGSTLYTALPADWNLDGRTDLLYVDAATRQWFVVPSTDTRPACSVNDLMGPEVVGVNVCSRAFVAPPGVVVATVDATPAKISPSDMGFMKA
jgi:hypothetical protein